MQFTIENNLLDALKWVGTDALVMLGVLVFLPGSIGRSGRMDIGVFLPNMLITFGAAAVFAYIGYQNNVNRLRDILLRALR